MSKSAYVLLRELGVTAPEEIDLEAIAGYCNAEVRYRQHDGCEARLVGNGDRAIISINSGSPTSRQRFGVGHELGHWLKDRGRISFLCEKSQLNPTSGNKSAPETRANEFAADLLMPAFLFSPRVQGLEVTLDTAKLLAETFRTSLTATTLRLVTHGDKPAAMVVSNGTTRDWYRLGPDVPVRLRPHAMLHDGCGPLQILKSGERFSEPVTVEADMWIDHRRADRYEIVEHCFRVSDDRVVTLLWWQDESQIIDLIEEED